MKILRIVTAILGIVFNFCLVTNSYSAEGDRLFPIEVANGKWGYIDIDGHLVVEPKYEILPAFSGRDVVAVKLDGKWGFINSKGEIVLQPQFEGLEYCRSSSLAAARINGKWGFIDIKGKVVIEPKFDRVDCFSWGGNAELATVQIGKKWGLIDSRGQIVLTPKYDDLSGLVYGMSTVQINGKWGYADPYGKILIEPKFDRAVVFNAQGLASVQINGKWGLINKAGNTIIAPQFDELISFTEIGLAKVKVRDKWGFINTQGKMIIEPQFEDAGYFTEYGPAYAKRDGKYGFIDTSGNFVIKPIFDHASSFYTGGLAPVAIDKKWGYIDTKGEFVIAPQYTQAWPFNKSGLATVFLSNNREYITTSGQMVVTASSGCGTTILFNKNNQMIWPLSNQKLSDCVLWSQAIEKIDVNLIKSLIARSGPPDDEGIIKIITARPPIDSGDLERRDFAQRQTEAIKLFVAAGKSPSTIDPRTKRSLLATAIQYDNPEVALALINLGADLSTNANEPVLIQALQLKNISLALAMLEHHANPDITNTDGITPLGFVMNYRSSGPIRACGKSATGPLNCRDIPAENYDRTMWVKLLLDHDANPSKRTPELSPLMLSVPSDAETIKLLINRGGKILSTSNASSPLGKESSIGPVTWTLQTGRDDLLPVALAQASNKLTPADRYAIAVAVKQNRLDIVRALLEKGADANLEIEIYGSLLHLAVAQRNLEIVRLLVKKGAKVNAQTPLLTGPEALVFGADSRLTPLMLACMEDNADMVRLLLDNGADPSMVSAKGATALSFTKTPAIIRLLQERESPFHWLPHVFKLN